MARFRKIFASLILLFGAFCNCTGCCTASFEPPRLFHFEEFSNPLPLIRDLKVMPGIATEEKVMLPSKKLQPIYISMDVLY